MDGFRFHFLLGSGSACLMSSTSSPFHFLPLQLPMMLSKLMPLITLNACVDFIILATVGSFQTVGCDQRISPVGLD